MPSISPSATGPAVSTVASSSGMSGTTISLEKSLSRLTTPMMTTVRDRRAGLLDGVIIFEENPRATWGETGDVVCFEFRSKSLSRLTTPMMTTVRDRRAGLLDGFIILEENPRATWGETGDVVCCEFYRRATYCPSVRGSAAGAVDRPTRVRRRRDRRCAPAGR